MAGPRCQGIASPGDTAVERNGGMSRDRRKPNALDVGRAGASRRETQKPRADTVGGAAASGSIAYACSLGEIDYRRRRRQLPLLLLLTTTTTHENRIVVGCSLSPSAVVVVNHIV
ncbi:Hypothetical protein CINCED_3A013083 [Cinara cedri]|uniref:Uncharacterized protein n=1 Tax=Cinara cedri TaxID=506608 RepID=A0A5E4MTQ9_9HEMI|nr:Hypothetical protein CINCED_3A013083 [Cinara cedri]